MRLEIERVDNGYIASFWDDDGGIKHQTVFEEGDNEHSDIECFQQLLYFIVEHFGMVGTKHDKRRIRIVTGAEDE